MRFRRELLTTRETAGFRCGVAELDEWLSRFAQLAQAKSIARVYIWLDDQDAVAAYFALAPHTISRGSLSSRQGRGSPEWIPAILLAKLALRSDLQGCGLGLELLRDALTVAGQAISAVGGRFFVVDAIDEGAAEFYERFGFTRSPDPSRLTLKASDLQIHLRQVEK